MLAPSAMDRHQTRLTEWQANPARKPLGDRERISPAARILTRARMRILRHAQIDVTMNVYTEVSDTKTLQVLKRLGRQLDR